MLKGSLCLLTDYGSDSSDNEMPVTERIQPKCSTKRTKSDLQELSDSEEMIQNKLVKLPLPEIFQTRSNQEDHIDDTSLHDGRIRSFVHERGNWATYVYIPCNNCYLLRDMVSMIKSTVPESFNIHEMEDLHISLTKTVVLKYHWINPFVESVRSRISLFRKFFILFNGVKIYCNEERTRTFIGLEICSGQESILGLVKLLDKCLEEFNLPTFYKDPSFHVSLAWCVGDFQDEFNEKYVPELATMLNSLLENPNTFVFAKSIVCKTGNKYFNFDLVD